MLFKTFSVRLFKVGLMSDLWHCWMTAWLKQLPSPGVGLSSCRFNPHLLIACCIISSKEMFLSELLAACWRAAWKFMSSSEISYGETNLLVLQITLKTDAHTQGFIKTPILKYDNKLFFDRPTSLLNFLVWHESQVQYTLVRYTFKLTSYPACVYF